MAKDGPNWEGLLKWSLAHADGAHRPRNLSEEDRKWFMEAMQAQTVDVIKRMKEITLVMQTPEQVLEAHGVTSADIEDMLDELQEHVESIDMANGVQNVLFFSLFWFDLAEAFCAIHFDVTSTTLSHLANIEVTEIFDFRGCLISLAGYSFATDLHSIGGLVPLLGYLKNSHAGIQAKAADVVTTIVQNNPRSQELVMEANGLEPLLFNFTSDPDVTVRTKALGAISCLIRNNKTGIASFRLANGYAALRDALGSENVRFQRKALNLVQYLLHENSSDRNVVSELGFPRIMMHLASSEDAEVREAALRGLLELARDKIGGTNDGLAEEDEKLKQILQERIKGISLMPPEDLGAAREERQLVDSLWNACYKEPSSLREKGLIVLPGEDAPPPDIASKIFEPPLRASAANLLTDNNSSNVKKEAPLLLGLGPSTETDPVQRSPSADGNEQ
ncbi:hypothetical protein HHK36_016363 [Tetracentron sinense]|uniref:TOG domain-containing protein n=1 Tax=Tetracentron sinense TaxID=13715 RepID=A0A834Z560_TETSI|nr:hypothetical protein HHK36_016363 [Tetracentron sinense]